MNNKTAKLLAAMLTVSLLLAGCSEKSDGANGDNSGSGTNTDAAGSAGGYSVVENENITIVKSPEGFTGNIGDVAIESGDTYAVITIEGFGAITVKLFPEAAPEGVQNFIDLANSGYYSGKEIHRVVEDFMFQGGSQNGDGMSTADDPSFKVEYNAQMRHFYGALCYANARSINGSQFYIVNSKKYDPVSIDEVQATVDELTELITASKSDDEYAYYQYYYDYYASILRGLKDSTEEIEAKYKEVGGASTLDGGYTVFGQTVDGFDVIDEISKVEVEQSSGGELSHPVQKIVIESVEIFTAE